MGVRIYRTRATREVWKWEVGDAPVSAAPVPLSSADGSSEDAVLIEFVIEASGGGGTRIVVGVTPDAFGRLAAAMALVDRTAAEAAFAAARPRSIG